MVAPDEVPRSGVAVAEDDVLPRLGRCAPDGVGGWLPVGSRVVDALQQPGGGLEALVGVLVVPALTAVLPVDEAQPLDAVHDAPRLRHAVEALRPQVAEVVVHGCGVLARRPRHDLGPHDDRTVLLVGPPAACRSTRPLFSAGFHPRRPPLQPRLTERSTGLPGPLFGHDLPDARRTASTASSSDEAERTHRGGRTPMLPRAATGRLPCRRRRCRRGRGSRRRRAPRAPCRPARRCSGRGRATTARDAPAAAGTPARAMPVSTCARIDLAYLLVRRHARGGIQREVHAAASHPLEPDPLVAVEGLARGLHPDPSAGNCG